MFITAACVLFLIKERLVFEAVACHICHVLLHRSHVTSSVTQLTHLDPGSSRYSKWPFERDLLNALELDDVHSRQEELWTGTQPPSIWEGFKDSFTKCSCPCAAKMDSLLP